MKPRHHDSAGQAAKPAKEPDAQVPPAPAPDPGRTDADAPAAEAADSTESQELQRLVEENRLLKQRLLEATADLDNQAKRFSRERQVVRDEITARTAREMIEVLDNLDRIVASITPEQQSDPILQGVSATRIVFLDKLRALGVVPIEASGRPFDPYQHEAISEVTRDDVAPGTVLDEVTRGYRLGSQLVRAAKVTVAKAPPKSSN